MVLVITEDELSFHDAPQMMYSGYSSAQSSERTVTKSWSASFDLDSTNHELENVHGSYITIQEEEYIYMKEFIKKAMNKNYLLQGEVTSLTKKSSFDEPPSNKQKQHDDYENEHIQHLKILALDIAECKAENDLKDLELNHLRSRLSMCCEQPHRQTVSRDVSTLVENRLRQCQQKTYEDQNQFFIEYIVSLSVLYAECKAEKDFKDLELKRLKDKIAMADEGKSGSEARSPGRKKMRHWLKNRLSQSRGHNKAYGQ